MKTEDNRVLIVDDDDTVCEMFGEALSNEGFHCMTASNGEDALKLLDDNTFDFMITDIIMPGMKGFQLVEKAKKAYPDLSVILMTGFVEDFSYDDAIEAGASDFIKKPFTPNELFMRMKHVKMQEKVRSMSVTDSLTGLLNRRGFFPMSDKQLKVSDRSGIPLVLLFADIDNLKYINDTWGHNDGDLALINISRIIKDTFRDSDIIARLGGDEFAILLWGGDEFETDLVIKRLQSNIDKFNSNVSDRYRLSLSVGHSNYDPREKCTIDELISKADANMYESKRAKRTIRQSSDDTPDK
ncbi:MAG: diguanylate cyclase [Nitrospirota bacterium]|nr:MAG: diguanylate cyclase [Nitrospirota bacterium]